MKALALGLLAAALTFSPPTSSAARHVKVTDGTLYKIELTGTAHVEARGSTETGLLRTKHNSSTLKADWTFAPKPTELWLAKAHGNDVFVTKAGAADDTSGTGHIHADETFTWFQPNAPGSPMLGTSSCDGSVKNQLGVQYTAEATSGGVALTVDLAGGFRTVAGAFVPCQNTPDERGHGQNGDPTPTNSAFAFAWNPKEPEGPAPDPSDPPNQRMQLGATLLPFQIGQPSPGPVLNDSSRVTSSLNCSNLFLEKCQVAFALTGSIRLTRICAGAVGSDGRGTCTGGGASGPKKAPGNPPPGAPKLTNLKVTPHALKVGQSARVTYTVDRAPTTTQLKISGKLTIAGHTVGPISLQLLRRDNATRRGSVPLSPSFLGKPLPAGTYTLEARPLDMKSGAPGRAVTTTFVITK